MAIPSPVPQRIELNTPELLASARSLPAFEGYPYLLTRVVPVLYPVLLLPVE